MLNGADALKLEGFALTTKYPLSADETVTSLEYPSCGNVLTAEVNVKSTDVESEK